MADQLSLYTVYKDNKGIIFYSILYLVSHKELKLHLCNSLTKYDVTVGAEVLFETLMQNDTKCGFKINI